MPFYNIQDASLSTLNSIYSTVMQLFKVFKYKFKDHILKLRFFVLPTRNVCRDKNVCLSNDKSLFLL